MNTRDDSLADTLQIAAQSCELLADNLERSTGSLSINAKDRVDSLNRTARRLRYLARRSQTSVGVTELMPGAPAFTMCAFSATQVPAGTQLYVLPPKNDTEQPEDSEE